MILDYYYKNNFTFGWTPYNYIKSLMWQKVNDFNEKKIKKLCILGKVKKILRFPKVYFI